jgi:hypothetical protein
MPAESATERERPEPIDATGAADAAAEPAAAGDAYVVTEDMMSCYVELLQAEARAHNSATLARRRREALRYAPSAKKPYSSWSTDKCRETNRPLSHATRKLPPGSADVGRGTSGKRPKPASAGSGATATPTTPRRASLTTAQGQGIPFSASNVVSPAKISVDSHNCEWRLPLLGSMRASALWAPSPDVRQQVANNRKSWTIDSVAPGSPVQPSSPKGKERRQAATAAATRDSQHAAVVAFRAARTLPPAWSMLSTGRSGGAASARGRDTAGSQPTRLQWTPQQEEPRRMQTRDDGDGDVLSSRPTSSPRGRPPRGPTRGADAAVNAVDYRRNLRRYCGMADVDGDADGEVGDPSLEKAAEPVPELPVVPPHPKGVSGASLRLYRPPEGDPTAERKKWAALLTELAAQPPPRPSTHHRKRRGGPSSAPSSAR